MKIAIMDIDDTITYETQFLLKKAPRFLRQKHLSDSIMNPSGYNLGEIYGISGKLEEHGLSSEEAILQERKLTDCFWNKHFLSYNMQQFRPNVKRIVDLLRENGYQVHFLSLRGKRTHKNSWKNEFIRKKDCSINNQDIAKKK